MKKFIELILDNFDAIIAIFLSLIAAIYGLFQENYFFSAIAGTLAVLAYSIIRDRTTRTNLINALDTLENFLRYEQIKKMCLKEFLPFREIIDLKIFDKMINEGKKGDEILIVGRTLSWLIKNKKQCLVEGLNKGLKFKLLLLNLAKVKDNTIDLSSVGVIDKRRVQNELDSSISVIEKLCQEASNYDGSLEYKLCNHIIFNSILSFTQVKNERRQIVFDFSFSEAEIDKYQQYYEVNSLDASLFVNKLYSFYQIIYDRSSQSVSNSTLKL